MCVQVGNPPTWLPLHHFLQLLQKCNTLGTQLLHLSDLTEMNPDSRFNVLNVIDGLFSNYTDLEQTSLLLAPFCVKYAEYGTELSKYI